MSETSYQPCLKLSLYFAEGEFYAACRRVGAPDIALNRFAYAENNALAVGDWLHEVGLQLTSDTVFSCVPSQFSQRLRYVELIDDLSDYSAKDRFSYFLASLNNKNLDAHGEMLFSETSAETAYVPILSGGKNFLASCTREDVFETGRVLLASVSSGDLTDDLDLNLEIESAARAAAREYLRLHPELADRSLRPFILFIALVQGFSLAVYHPEYGIIDEYAEPYFVPNTGDFYDIYDDYISHAFTQLADRYGDGNKTQVLAALGVSHLENVIIAVAPALKATVAENIEAAELDGFSFTATVETAEQLITCGLLAEDPTGGTLAPLNYLDDLTGFAALLDEESQNEARIALRKTRARTALLVFAPFVIAIGILAGLYVNAMRDQTVLAYQLSSETARAEQLAPQKTKLESYIRNYSWYKETFSQVTNLRTAQKAAISLLTNLNSRFPLELDGSFSVNELKLTAAGALELKGTAQAEDAATAFVRSLEYAPSELRPHAKMFENLSFDVRRGGLTNSPVAAAAVNPEQMNNAVSFIIKGTYTAFAAPPVQTAAK